MIRAIEHIAIVADNSTALARWYCDTLGFTLAVADEGTKTYFVRLPGGGVLELLPSNRCARVDHANDDAGLRHVALAVDDFDAVYQTLQARGVHFVGPPREFPGGPKLVFFADPEGNLLHLVWRPKPL